MFIFYNEFLLHICDNDTKYLCIETKEICYLLKISQEMPIITGIV